MNKISKTLIKGNESRKEPFFIRKNNEQVYSGFPLVTQTETEGFTYGAITDYLDPDSEEGCTWGDGFVQAPDGSRAGLVWEVSNKSFLKTLTKPNSKRWGIYSINFPKPIKTIDDLVYNFRLVLPGLIDKYNKVKKD